MDVLFINSGNAKVVYQDLSKDYSAIEPPTWALLLAESCRSQKFKVGILDMNAENLSFEEASHRITKLKPRLICFVVYGQNVNAGTVGMSGAAAFSKFLKNNNSNLNIALIGSYAQSLPYKVLSDEESIDFIFTNEGVYSLWNILKLEKIDPNYLEHIKGIGWRKNGKVTLNPPEKLVPQERMDIDLPGYAWDLLPMKEKALDLYRAPMWHAEYDHAKRSPYAAIQTSLGCPFACSFCMINIINRDDNDPIGVAGNYSKMRFWSPEFIIKEFDKLDLMGVNTIRIVDEMFLLNKKYYQPLCELLSERPYSKSLRMWAYSRIDTITNSETLDLVRKAGIKWLCLGIESGNRNVRLEVSKGKFQDLDIRKVIQHVHDAGIEVLANYIFGLPGETQESMEETLNLSLELCTSGWNAYTAMPLPGSQLYKDALEKGYKLPKDYSGFSFHSYTTSPMPTDKLSAAEILKFRDQAYTTYHTAPNLLNRIKTTFGPIAVNNIKKMTEIGLKREILGD